MTFKQRLILYAIQTVVAQVIVHYNQQRMVKHLGKEIADRLIAARAV